MGVFGAAGGGSGKRGFGGGSSLFGSEGSDEISVDLNLTPLMDVMSNILFFLLAAFGAAVVSFLAVSVPVQSDAPGAPPPTDAVTVNLRVLPDAYRLSISNEEVDPEKLAQYGAVLPKVNGAYDDAALAERVYRIKLDFPASDTLIILPDQATRYEDLIRIMDATREREVEGKKLRLLPKVVVANLVEAETAQ